MSLQNEVVRSVVRSNQTYINDNFFLTAKMNLLSFKCNKKIKFSNNQGSFSTDVVFRNGQFVV